MQCKYCGQRLLETAKRCPNCKTVFTEEDIREMLGGRLPREDQTVTVGYKTEAEKAADSARETNANEFGREENAWEKSREESWKNVSQGRFEYEGSAGRENSGQGYGYRQSAKDGTAPYEMTVEERRRIGFARIGFWCGCVSVFLCLMEPLISVGLGVIGLITAINGIKSPLKRRAVTGLVLCIVAILTAICFYIMSSALADNIDWTRFLEQLAESQGLTLE